MPPGVRHSDPGAPWNATAIIGECLICSHEITEDEEMDAVERRLWDGRNVSVCPECVQGGKDVCLICGEWFGDGETACTDCNCLRPTHGDDRCLS